jgi:hypothetical protein
MFIRHPDGKWKEISSIFIVVNNGVNNVWRSLSSAFINVAGVWKNIFSSAPTLTWNWQQPTYVSTNGYVGFDSGSVSEYSKTSVSSTSGKVLRLYSGDLIQEQLYYAADYFTFYIYWVGRRAVGGTSGEIRYAIELSNALNYAYVWMEAPTTSSISGYYYNGVEQNRVASFTSGSKYAIFFNTNSPTTNAFIPKTPLNFNAYIPLSTTVTSGTANDGYTALNTSQGSAPTPPTNITLSSMTATTANFTWSAPNNIGQSKIVSYEYATNSNGPWTNVYLNTSAAISGTYVNGQNYTFYFRASNELFPATAASTTSVTVPASFLLPALVPIFGTNTSVSGGFTGYITNSSSSWPTWTITASVGSVTWTSPLSDGVRSFAVSGLTSGQSSTVTVTSDRSGYAQGSNSTTGTASVPVLYTVTWNANGGSVSPSSSTQTTSGGPISVPTPTYPLFTFQGWWDSLSGGTQIISSGTSTYIPTQSRTLYAQWTTTPIIPQLILQPNSNVGQTAGTINWYSPEQVSFVTTGNKFATTGTTAKFVTSTTLTAATTYTGLITVKSSTNNTVSTSYSLTTNPSLLTPSLSTPVSISGGFTTRLLNGSASNSYTISASTGLISATYTGADTPDYITVSGLYAGDTATVTVTAYRAGYDPVPGYVTGVPQAYSYSISFNANGGAGTTMSSISGTAASVTLPANTYTRLNYFFTRWNTQPSGSGTYYTDGARILLSSGTTLSLWAQWTAGG